MKERMIAGPACVAAATPVSTKMPAPIIWPMPMKVRSAALKHRRSGCASSPAGSFLRNTSIRARLRSPLQCLLVVGEHLLGRGYAALEPFVDLNRLPQRACRALEARLYDVVAVLAVDGLDVQTDAGVLRQRLEPLAEQLGVHLADLRPLEADVPDQIGPVREVDGDAGQRLVHRHQDRAEPPDPGEIAQRLLDRLADDDRRVLGRVVEV